MRVITGREAVAVNAEEKSVKVKDTATGAEETFTYDKLVIATGASPAVPPVKGMGLSGVFIMRTPEDAVSVRAYVDANSMKKAVVVGAGFIGLEVAENLKQKGVTVTVIDFASQILPSQTGIHKVNHHAPTSSRATISKNLRLTTLSFFYIISCNFYKNKR